MVKLLISTFIATGLLLVLVEYKPTWIENSSNPELFLVLLCAVVFGSSYKIADIFIRKQ